MRRNLADFRVAGDARGAAAAPHRGQRRKLLPAVGQLVGSLHDRRVRAARLLRASRLDTTQLLGKVSFWDVEPLSTGWGIPTAGMFDLEIDAEARVARESPRSFWVKPSIASRTAASSWSRRRPCKATRRPSRSTASSASKRSATAKSFAKAVKSVAQGASGDREGSAGHASRASSRRCPGSLNECYRRYSTRCCGSALSVTMYSANVRCGSMCCAASRSERGGGLAMFAQVE